MQGNRKDDPSTGTKPLAPCGRGIRRLGERREPSRSWVRGRTGGAQRGSAVNRAGQQCRLTLLRACAPDGAPLRGQGPPPYVSGAEGEKAAPFAGRGLSYWTDGRDERVIREDIKKQEEADTRLDNWALALTDHHAVAHK